MMGWDVLIQLLSWAVPGGLGAGVTWLASRHQRRAREAKEVHDTYRQMYDDVSATLSSIQTKNNELNETLDKIRHENGVLRRAVNGLTKAIEAVNSCRHYADCPVRRELPLVADVGEVVAGGALHGTKVRHVVGTGRGGVVGKRDPGRHRVGQHEPGPDSGDAGLSSGRRVVVGRKGCVDPDGEEDLPGPSCDNDDSPG